jgi:hypothetical protein
MSARITIEPAHIPQAEADIKQLRACANRADCLAAADALEAAVRRALRRTAKEKSRR